MTIQISESHYTYLSMNSVAYKLVEIVKIIKSKLESNLRLILLFHVEITFRVGRLKMFNRKLHIAEAKSIARNCQPKKRICVRVHTLFLCPG